MAEKTSQSLSATGGDSTHAAAASMGSPAPAELLSVPGEAPNCIISGSIHKEGRGMFGSIKFRYFELTGSMSEDHILTYWDSEQKSKLISSMNLKGAKHSATKKKRDKYLFSLRIDMDATLPGNNYSKIVLLFNDEQNYNRWNSTLTAILSSDRLFSRAVFSASSSGVGDAAPDGLDAKAWQEWQQEHARSDKVGGGAAGGLRGNGRPRSKSGGSATEFLMESPRRSRFLVSVEKDYSQTSFVPVITCSDDVPRMHLLAELPPLSSVAAGAIAGLFTRKLELCCLQFDFTTQEDPNSDFELCRQKKREVLLEIYKYLDAVPPQSPLPPKLLQQLLVMIQCNILRPLPAIAPDHHIAEADGDELPSEIAWTHIGVVYDILLLCSQPGCFSKQHIIDAFNSSRIDAIVNLFQSSDTLEREKLQRIVHNLYAKFLSLRPAIKQAMCILLQQRVHVVAALECHPNSRSRLSEFGTAEMLTILDSVANGFVLPLKEEHVVFFLQTLLPLYRSCSLARFAASLTCICRTFMTKDAALSHDVIKHLLRYWPISSSEKLLVFLCTIKDAIAFLPNTGDLELALAKELMERLRSCMGSQSRDILQTGLELWQQKCFTDLVEKYKVQDFVFRLFGDLPDVFAQHWCKDLQPFFDRAIQELDSLGMVASREADVPGADELKKTRAMMWKQLEQQQ